MSTVPDEPDIVMGDDYGAIQVVMPPAIQEPFREWLASRGLNLFPIPVEDDLPTYGIGIGDALWERAQHADGGGSRP
jgi:hypothetical protein